MDDRKNKVLNTIKASDKPISASTLAKMFHVSRQIIVGDVALLRASGHMIVATPRGYVMDSSENQGIVKTIAVCHDNDLMLDELYTIVDLGGKVLDVIVDHPVYGQISANLHLSSRYDCDRFYDSVIKSKAKPLLHLTNGLHLHTIVCQDEVMYERIIERLKQLHILYEKENNLKT